MDDTDELSVLAEASRYLFRSLLLVRDADLRAPTPCQDWDLRRLLAHIHDSLQEVTDVLTVPTLDGHSGSVSAAGSDPVAPVRAGIIDLLLASTSLPIAGRWCEAWGRYLPAQIVVNVAAIEMALHGWDIAQACSTARPIPGDLASALLGLSAPLAEAGVAEHLVAKPLAVSRAATPSDRLLALFGRQHGRRVVFRGYRALMNDGVVDRMATEALGLLTEAVEQIASDGWDQPSNLEGWSVRDLVGHATGSATKVVTLVEDRPIWQGPSQPDDWKSDDPTARLRELAARLQDALPSADLDGMRPSPQGEVPLRRALTFPVSDLALHSWDVYRSQGRLVELPEDLLAFCRTLVDSLPEEMLRRPGAFGPAQPAPADATPTTRLMAHLGRSV